MNKYFTIIKDKIRSSKGDVPIKSPAYYRYPMSIRSLSLIPISKIDQYSIL